MGAATTGENLFNQFKRERLESNVVDFFANMKRQNLKTFTDVFSKSIRIKEKEVVLKAERNLFVGIVVISQTRQLDMKDVLCHPLGPIPWSLSNVDGTIRKTNKANFMSEPLKNAPVAGNFQGKTACIIDGMSIMQKINGTGKTFREIAKIAFQTALREGVHSEKIDIVFDSYRKCSIKMLHA